MKMSIIDFAQNAANFMGRLKGHYQRGIEDPFRQSGARPSLGDDSAWIDPYGWGAALLEGHQPHTKQDFINSFRSWVYICAKQNAQTVASQRLRLYVAKKEKTKEYRYIETRPVEKLQKKWLYSRTFIDNWLTKAAEIEEVTEHIWLDLMKNVNPYHNSRDLKEFTTLYSDLTGECYWLLLKNNLKVPDQIWVMPSQFMSPKFGKSLDKAIEAYVYKRGNIEITLKVEDVIMFTYPNPSNIFTGFSCVKGVAAEVYIQQQMNEFEAAMFENRARVGGVFEETENIGKEERGRIKEKLKQEHTGAKKAGKNLYLPKGLKYTRDTMTPEEISFIEGRRLNAELLSLAFDIPPGALWSKDVNKANASVADERHAKNGILPRCERFAEKMNEKVLPLYNDQLFCAFDNPVPEDKEFLHQERRENVEAGIISRDEARSDIGKEPKGGAADDLFVDSRKVPISSEPTEEEVRELARRAKERLKEILNA